MRIANQQLLAVDQAQAWSALNDTEILKACIVGCESLAPTGEHAFEVGLQVAVGPVRARFKGKLRLFDLDPPTSYSIDFEGQGGAAGHGKGVAKVRLEAQGPAHTLLHYEVSASVGGKLAQIGQRLVDMAAQKMAADFFERFDAEMKRRHTPPVASLPAADETLPHEPVARSWLARLLDRMAAAFGRGRAPSKVQG